MSAVFFEVESWERPVLESTRQSGDTLVTEPLRAAGVETYADAEVISPFLRSELRAPVLASLPKLRLIATRSTGVDHIDLAYCRAHNIAVANVPAYGERTVAEHVFALLLTISHKMVDAVNQTRRGDFSLRGLQGFDLEGKTLGVIGTGAIGRHVIRIARGFDMRVLAYDVRPDADFAHQVGCTYAPLDDVRAAADVVTLHVPALPQTQNLISFPQFERMKPGVVLINTARGSIVNVRALLQALAEGKVAAAGLDVLPEEPAIHEEAELLRSFFGREHDLETLLADHVLLRMRNVYITPHSAFATREASRRILDTTRANIAAFLAGKPQNLVVGS